MFYKGLYLQYYLLYHGCVMEEEVFVTGRGGAVLHPPEPVHTLGPLAFIPWKGPICYYLCLMGTHLGYSWGGGLSGDKGREGRKRDPVPGR